ncbi:CAAX protease [Brachybacterium sp. P6-10-X1]|nr:CAAX protease [Brachybacterium sp. P6-10-X1]
MVPPLVMIILQIALFAIVGLIDHGSGQTEAVGPLQLLAVNLSMGITGVLTVPLICWWAKVPWRSILSAPRAFDQRRLAVYLLWALGVTILANAALALLAPEQTPWVGVGFTGTTMALLVVIVLTTPLAAVSEELMFRGAVMPAVASWVRPERIALALGVIVSSLAFATTHLATDPWLFAHHVFLGLATAVMAIRSRGLEAPIAFHVANNTFTAVLNTLLAGGGDFSVARTAGAGGPHLLIPALFVLALVIVVWRREGNAAEPEAMSTRHAKGVR